MVVNLHAHLTVARGSTTPIDRAIQEETFKALAHEKEGWQRKHKGHISAIDCDRNHFIAQMTILKGYIGSLMGELRGYEIPVLLMPTMQ